jgi:hypothetical protein
MQLHGGRGHRDRVVELGPVAGAIGEQILARAPALVDVDAPRIQQVGAQREVQAPGRLAGVREDRQARLEKGGAPRRVDVERAGDDDGQQR